MAPSKKTLAPANLVGTSRRTRAQAKKESEQRRMQSKAAIGSDPLQLCLVDSDSEPELQPATKAPRTSLVPYESSSDESKVASLVKSTSVQAVSSGSSSPATKDASTSVSSERTESMDMDIEPEAPIFPPLPAIKVSLADFVRKVPYDVEDRKTACQYSQSQLELEHPGVWDAKDPFSDRFLVSEGVSRFNLFRQRSFFEDKIVLHSHDRNAELLGLLNKNKLLGAVQDPESYVRVTLSWNFTRTFHRWKIVNMD